MRVLEGKKGTKGKGGEYGRISDNVGSDGNV